MPQAVGGKRSMKGKKCSYGNLLTERLKHMWQTAVASFAAYFLLLPSTAFTLEPSTASCLIDLESGQILLAENASAPIKTASVLPAIAVYATLMELQRNSLDISSPLETPVPENRPATPPASNTADTIEDALRAILAASSREALAAIANTVFHGAPIMAASMNERAAALGLHISCSAPAEGQQECISSSEDAARLVSALYRDFPVARILAVAPGAKFGDKVLPNSNPFLKLSNAVTGLTFIQEAHGWSGLIIAENPRPTGRLRRLVAAVLNAEDEKSLRNRLSTMLLRAYRDYDTIRIFDAGDVVAKLPLYRGKTDFVDAIAEKPVYATLSRERMLERGSNAVEIRIERRAPLAAPIHAGDRLGQACIFIDNKLIGTTPIVAATDVQESSFWKRLIDTVRLALDAKREHPPAAEATIKSTDDF